MNTNYKSDIAAGWHWQILSAVCFSVFLLIGLASATNSIAQNILDPTFGNGGKVITHVFDADFANSVLLQPDSKFIVAGSTDFTTSFDFVVKRNLVFAKKPTRIYRRGVWIRN